MSVSDKRNLLDRLVARRDSLWKLLVDANISETLANAVASELRTLESRIFSIQCSLVRA
jgi:hypothetical protein